MSQVQPYHDDEMDDDDQRIETFSNTVGAATGAINKHGIVQLKVTNKNPFNLSSDVTFKKYETQYQK